MGIILTVLIGIIFAMFFYSLSIFRDLHNTKVLLRDVESDRDRLAKNNTDSSRLKERQIVGLNKKLQEKDKSIAQYTGAIEKGVTVKEFIKQEEEARLIREHQEVVRKKLDEDRLQKERETQEINRRQRESNNHSGGHSRGYSGGRRSGSSSGLYGYLNESNYSSSSRSCDSSSSSSSSSSSDSSSCGGSSD
jgi:hypothetical protein